jgi:NADH-quinone oxidoreductase subunit E
VGVTPLQVNEVLSYYSMLHRKPLGKYHVQVCTNISCLLHDGDKLYEHACKKLGIGTRKSPPTGSSRSRKWSAWAPAPGPRPSR